MKLFVDKIIIEARTKAIEKAYIPRDLLRKYKTQIVAGKLIIGEKK